RTRPKRSVASHVVARPPASPNSSSRPQPTNRATGASRSWRARDVARTVVAHAHAGGASTPDQQFAVGPDAHAGTEGHNIESWQHAPRVASRVVRQAVIGVEEQRLSSC